MPRGLWPPWHAAVLHGVCPLQSLLVAVSPKCCRPAQAPQQSLQASITVQPHTDHLLIFSAVQAKRYRSVRSYYIHSTSQKGIRASQNVNVELKVGFVQGDVSLSGN